jgi:hypothetical protein
MATAIAAFAAGVGGAVTIAGIDLGPIASGSGAPGRQTPPDTATPPPPPNGEHVGDPCNAGGNTPGHKGWTHLEGGNADHYGTHWMWTCLSN